MSTSNKIQLILISLTALGLIMTVYQLYQTRKLKRLDLVKESWQSIMEDEELMDLYYRLEYSDFQYNTDFHGSNDEKLLDRLLGRFQLIAMYYERGVLNWSDIMIMEYHIDRIVLNSEVQKYFKFLDSWAIDQKIKEHAFKAVERVALRYLTKHNKID